MRVLEFQRMLACVLAGPALSWLLGRFTGRRDWQIAPLLVTLMILNLLVQALIFLDLPMPGLHGGVLRGVF